MYDVMIKRLHEYKRQLLKLLHVCTLYRRMRQDPSLEVPARVVLFGAKAAPGYQMAKLIIRLINQVGPRSTRTRRWPGAWRWSSPPTTT